jgi:CRISPR-associated protein Cas1
MSSSEWQGMGYSKGTLHYMKKGAKEEKPFKVYGKVEKRLIY